VAGALGPTSRTASISPDVNDPAFRNIDFDELAAAIHGGCPCADRGGRDAILIETIFDTLNAKAALFAVREALDELGVDLPIIVSGTITDASGRTLSGQTTEAFWNSIRHARPAVVGLNCALGGKQLRPYIEELARLADTYVCAYPNAGSPERIRRLRRERVRDGGNSARLCRERVRQHGGRLLRHHPRAHPRNGGEAVKGHRAARRPGIAPACRLERIRTAHHRCRQPLRQRRRAHQRHRFRQIPQADRGGRLRGGGRHRPPAGGEWRTDHRRQHGRGNARFAGGHGEAPAADCSRAGRCARAGDDRFVEMVGHRSGTQVRAGQVDRQFHQLEGGRGCVPEHARKVMRYGAAVVVMAFDEKGQADTVERKIAICERAFKLLTEKIGFAPEDIIFDPNIFAVATGIEEHNRYSLDFIEATAAIKRACPPST
jgi:5-methyltetrahydrofolate--homocysteine methyltransferase